MAARTYTVLLHACVHLCVFAHVVCVRLRVCSGPYNEGFNWLQLRR